jgi:putative two-component system response regulator
MTKENLEKPTVLVVDDAPENIDILYGILKDTYEIQIAKNGKVALIIAAKFIPDIILLDIMMPEMDGYEVCEALKENPLTCNIPVIFVTSKDQDFDEAHGFKLGAADYMTKPVSPAVVKARVKTHLALYDQQRELARQVKEKTKELSQSRLEVIRMLGVASEYRDNDTGEHVERMSRYCYVIAKNYGLAQEEADILLHASPLHDVGKIGVPDNILLKPGKLFEDEWTTMQKHCNMGGDIISDMSSELLMIAKQIAIEHHEKWNGKGYPFGLKGEEISLNARIVSVADVFDALTSQRPYKDAWEVQRAVDLIKKEANQQFDPKVVDAFEKALPEILEIKDKLNSK